MCKYKHSLTKIETSYIVAFWTVLKSGKKCLDPNLKNEITRSILKINKRFIAHFNR